MTQEKTKYCHHCGAMIPYFDRYCPACSKLQPTLPGMLPIKEESRKNIWLAVILSFLITGLGQYYLGARRRAVAFFTGTLLLGAILSYILTQDQILGLGVVMAIISAIDAYQIGIREKDSQ